MSSILSVKTKNRIRKQAETAGMDVEFNINNISIDGARSGCSGFVRNTANGSTVYLDTEPSYGPHPPLMYRYADSMKDNRGYRNCYAYSLDELAVNVIGLLEKTPKEAGAYRV